MGKPDDIPQDVRETATEWHEAIIGMQATGLSSETLIPVVIARAIMAAKAEEREACAELCAGHIELVGSKGRWLEPHEILNEEVHTGLTYAAAIRKRGEG